MNIGSAPHWPSGLTVDDERLLARIPHDRLAINGIPTEERIRARERAAEVVRRSLPELLDSATLHASPLGVAWSNDIDVFAATRPDPEMVAKLGWLPLDGLLERLGSDPGEGRWAVLDGGEVLGCVDFSVGSPPDPVATILRRCRRMGVVRAREILELRALVRSGRRLPADPAVRAAPRGEAALGGDVLAAFLDKAVAAAAPPVEIWPGIVRGLWRRRPSLRPRLVVAISGVDGSGKSTLCRAVADRVARAGLPVAIVWTRPGMGVGLGPFEAVARAAKRRMGRDDTPGVRRVAKGERLSWRRGLVGWTWAMVITLSFVADVWRQHVRGTGVLLYDRHLLDALVTLDVVYEGVGLEMHRALVRRLVPKTALTVYLDVAPEVAAGRNPDDSFGEPAVRLQLERYEELLAALPERANLRRLDATSRTQELADQVFQWLVELDPEPLTN